MKYDMNLNDKPFKLIKKGTKTVELRLNDNKRQLLKINDLIEFTNRETNEKLLMRVDNLYKYNSFEELYNHFNKIELGYDTEDVADPKDMDAYYSMEEQSKYGVVGIKIKKYLED